MHARGLPHETPGEIGSHRRRFSLSSVGGFCQSIEIRSAFPSSSSSPLDQSPQPAAFHPEHVTAAPSRPSHTHTHPRVRDGGEQAAHRIFCSPGSDCRRINHFFTNTIRSLIPVDMQTSKQPSRNPRSGASLFWQPFGQTQKHTSPEALLTYNQHATATDVDLMRALNKRRRQETYKSQ